LQEGWKTLAVFLPVEVHVPRQTLPSRVGLLSFRISSPSEVKASKAWYTGAFSKDTTVNQRPVGSAGFPVTADGGSAAEPKTWRARARSAPGRKVTLERDARPHPAKAAEVEIAPRVAK